MIFYSLVFEIVRKLRDDEIVKKLRDDEIVKKLRDDVFRKEKMGYAKF